jgi:hypothetical protein
MKKPHTKSGSSREGHENEVGIVELLQELQGHAKQGVNVGWLILKKLKDIDESISLFAAQKKRELTPGRPDGAVAP